MWSASPFLCKTAEQLSGESCDYCVVLVHKHLTEIDRNVAIYTDNPVSLPREITKPLLYEQIIKHNPAQAIQWYECTVELKMQVWPAQY